MTVSFIVPTRNSARTIQACLRSLVEQHHADVEIIVVDNHSTDGTVAIAQEWADRVVNAGPERSAQRNLGAFLSTGEVVTFIDSDMVLEPSVAGDIAAAFAMHPDTAALVIPELAFGQGFLARCRALEKRLYLGDASVEAVRAIDREVFEQVGGWDEDLTAGEDWDLTDRVRATGRPVGRVASCIWHDEGRIRLGETFRKKRYYGTWVTSYIQKQGGTGGRKLARTSLLSNPRELAANPVETAGMLTLKSVEAAGLALGMAGGRRNPALAGLAAGMGSEVAA